MRQQLLSIATALALSVNALGQTTTCFNIPDGIDTTWTGGWSYKEYVIPNGYKIDSVSMDATRAGYSASQEDFIFSYCAGTAVYNSGTATEPFNYATDNNSEYNHWINLSSFNYMSVGVIRVFLPVNAGATWNNLCFALSPVCGIDLNTGLVATYDFTGNANDGSGNGNNGVVNAATLTADRFGNPNSAYSFNGSTSYIDVPNSSSLAFPANKISISYWVKFNAFTSIGTDVEILMCKQSGYGSSQEGFNVYQVGIMTNGLVVKSTNPGGDTINYGSLNQFHHITYVYDNGNASSYLDGALVNTFSGQTAIIGANTNDLIIGKPSWVYSNSFAFNGVLDDIKIYNRALNPCEVDSLYTMPNPITTGIAENKTGSVSVYPNPANTNVTVAIYSNTDKNISLELFDLLGNLIQKTNKSVVTGDNKIDINLSELNAGVYFIRVDNTVEKIQIIK